MNVSVVNLKCERSVNPIGIAKAEPLLSWILASDGRNAAQSAYQVIAASSADLLVESQADLWDSGKVASSKNFDIPYQGRALASRESCHWSARVWDTDDRPSNWAAAATFEMGLLDESDWHGAAWIGRAGEPGQSNPAPYLRREFEVAAPVKRARLYACCLGYGDLSINGKKVAPGTEREQAYTAYSKRVLYVTYDVTHLIQAGTNALGAILGTGFFDVHDIAVWNYDKAPWRDRPKMRCVLVVENEDGGEQTIVSDDDWRVATGPILRDGIYTGEVYDARLAMPGWDTAGFEDGAWQATDIMAAPGGKIHPRVCPPVMIGREIAPVAITEPAPGVHVFDFGENFSGHAKLNVSAPAGTTVNMQYSELIDAAGRVDRTDISMFMQEKERVDLFQADTYICDGSGGETWEQRFSYAGFQYAEVTGLTAAPDASTLTGRFAYTALDSAGEFSCSDEMLNKIQQATRQSYLSNAQDIPTDCPQREKNGWTGDVQLACEAGLMNFDTQMFYTKWLDDVQDSQWPEGSVPHIIPNAGWDMGGICHPAWDSVYAILMWDLYRYRGDERILQRHFGNVARWVDYVSTRFEDGIIQFESLGDWLPWKAETPSTLTSTAFVYRNCVILTNAARVLGLSANAEKYAALGASTKEAYNKHFLKADEATYESDTQTALAISLFFDLVPSELRGRVLDRLVERMERSPQIDAGILGAKYVLRVLSEAGRADLAYKIVTQPNEPSWAAWINRGLTTLPENWRDKDSRNHIMFGDVSNWMFQWVAGIGLDESSPGFKHFTVQPQFLGDLTWAQASHETVYGRIGVRWERKEGGLFLSVEVPANTTATVRLPCASGESVSGEGGLQRGYENGCAILEVGSGRYEFHAAA